MESRSSIRPGLAWALADAGLLTLVWTLLHLLRFGHPPPFHRGPFVVLPLLIVIQWVLGSYDALAARQSTYQDQLQRFVAAAFAVIAMFVIGYALSGKVLDISIGRGFLLPLLFSGLVSGMLIRALGTVRHVWQPQQRWLMMVTPEQRRFLAREVEQGGCEIPAALEWRPRQSRTSLAPMLPDLLRLDGIVLGAGPPLREADQRQLEGWQAQGLQLLPLLPWCERFLMRLPAELLPRDPAEREWMLSGARYWQRMRLKRLVDVLVAGVLLFPLAAVLAFLLLWRWLRGSRPSPLVHTLCLGRDARPFQQIRLAGGGSLQRTLAALPQLWNVLRGEMSLVGPRPITPSMQAEAEAVDPAFRLRLRMRPGLTGWGRISGAPSAEVDGLRWELQRDLYYLRHGGIKLDLTIMARAALQQLALFLGLKR
jgi:lipopolysaccharide/colanic/teichoic acid biosynthesis glycosyltransferase